MVEKREKIHHEIVWKKGILIIISLLIETTWGDQCFFFECPATFFGRVKLSPTFLGLGRRWCDPDSGGSIWDTQEIFFGEKREWDFVFFVLGGVEVGKIWKVFLWKKYSCIWDCEMCFCWWWLVKDLWFQLLWFFWNDFVPWFHLFSGREPFEEQILSILSSGDQPINGIWV